MTMTNYVLAYRGGGMPATQAEQDAAMAQWGSWFGELGDAVANPGAPFGASKTVTSDGSMNDGNQAGLSGYSVVAADSLAAATDLAKGCPVLTSGGSVEVYETLDM
jgi:hypothetical protein